MNCLFKWVSVQQNIKHCKRQKQYKCKHNSRNTRCFKRTPLTCARISLDYAKTLNVMSILRTRVTFAMIGYITFNNHKRTISHSLWNGHANFSRKITLTEIFGVERRITVTFQICHDQCLNDCVEQKLRVGFIKCVLTV